MFTIGEEVQTLIQLDSDSGGISLPKGTVGRIHELPEDNGRRARDPTFLPNFEAHH